MNATERAIILSKAEGLNNVADSLEGTDSVKPTYTAEEVRDLLRNTATNLITVASL